jgi:hypothetical protein
MAIQVTVTIPQALKDMPAEMRRRGRLVVEEVTRRTAEQARENVGHEGRLSRSIEGRVTGDATGEVVATAPHAKAQEEGAYIVPRKGRMLRFRDSRTGETVFTRGPVRLKPKRYMKRAAKQSKSFVNDAVRKHFGGLG